MQPGNQDRPAAGSTLAKTRNRIRRIIRRSILGLAFLAIAMILAGSVLGLPQLNWLFSTYTQPLLPIFSICGLAGILWRKRALERAALVGFLLVSWPPVEWLLSRPLEISYPVQPFRCPATVQAVVVLSSSVRAPEPAHPYPLPDQATFSRCEFAAWIHRNRPELPVIASGGSAGGNQPAMAETMAALLRQAGVPQTMIWTEDLSRNTHESAVYCADILRRRGIREIALVVEARSMFRAAACFRKQGITVVPAPSAFRDWDTFGEEILPGWRTIARNEVTLHEMAGIVWYRLKGWI
jgi:uncharacterized SAM-binding protein YcdF (DUF218 family)